MLIESSCFQCFHSDHSMLYDCPQTTWHTSSSQDMFLEVDMHLNYGHTHMSVHMKLTNLQQYLHFSSCQSSSTKCSIPFSLAVWGQCICSYPDNFYTYTINLTLSFLTRVYLSAIITKQISCPLLSHAARFPHPAHEPNPVPLFLHIILAFLNSNVSLEMISTFTLQISPPSFLNPQPLSTSADCQLLPNPYQQQLLTMSPHHLKRIPPLQNIPHPHPHPIIH